MKKKNWLSFAICIVIAIVFVVASMVLHYMNEDEMGIYLEDVAATIIMLIVGVVLLFVKLRGWGWIFAVVLGILAIVGAIVDGDLIKIFSGIVILAVGIIMLLIYNVKKKNKNAN